MRWIALVVSSWCWFGGVAEAQSTPTGRVFASFVRTCTAQAGAGAAHTCACVATAVLDRCASSATTEAALNACVVQNEPAVTQSVLPTCQRYGAIRLGPGVPVLEARPSPLARQGVEVLSDLEVWTSFFNGCSQAEPALAYSCGCFATALVSACVPNGSAAAPSVDACMQDVQPDLERMAAQCGADGAIHVRASGAQVPTTAAPPTDPDAVRICGQLDGGEFTVPAQRAACEALTATLVSADVDAFLAVATTATTRVRLYGRANSNAAAVRARIEREGGLHDLLGAQSATMYMTPSAHLVVYSGDIVDRPAPEASFRWRTETSSWELESISVPRR